MNLNNNNYDTRNNFIHLHQVQESLFGADIEYGAMVYSVPMPCKRCGSRRTLPVLQLPYYAVYKKIWKTME